MSNNQDGFFVNFFEKNSWLNYLPSPYILPSIVITCALFIIGKFFLKNSDDIDCIFPIMAFVRLKFSLGHVVAHYYDKLVKEKFFGMFYGLRFLLIVRDPAMACKIISESGGGRLKLLHQEVIDDDVMKALPRLNDDRQHRVNELIAAWVESQRESTKHATGVNNDDVARNLADECVKEFLISLEAKANRGFLIETDEYCRRHAYNIVGICIFGLNTTTLTSSSKNQFYPMCAKLRDGQSATAGGWAGKINGLYRGRNENQNRLEAVDYFRNEVRDALIDFDDQRRRRPSLIDHLIESVKRSGFQNHISDDDVEWITSIAIATCVKLIPTVCRLMSALLYELAANEEAQQNFRKFSSFNKDYNSYFHCLIAETSRKYPERDLIKLNCVADNYNLPNTKLWINPAVHIVIPVHCILADPTLFHHPTDFIPARFEKKSADAGPDADAVADSEDDNYSSLYKQLMTPNVGHYKIFNRSVENYAMGHIQLAVSRLVGRYKLTVDEIRRQYNKPIATQHRDTGESYRHYCRNPAPKSTKTNRTGRSIVIFTLPDN